MDVPALRGGRLTWALTSLWSPSAAVELRSAGAVVAEGEWIDSKPREWRVEIGATELAFRVVARGPVRIEAALLPDRSVQLTHCGSLKRARPSIEIGTASYRFVRTGLSKTAYRTLDRTTVSRMTGPAWGKLHMDLFGSSCPDWHLWLLACSAGFRLAWQHRNPFNIRTHMGLKQLCDPRGR